METLLLLLGLIVSPGQYDDRAAVETVQVEQFGGSRQDIWYQNEVEMARGEIPELDSILGRIPATAQPVGEGRLHGAAAVIAACESGHRLADGTAELGSHDWRVENPSPASSASGAFQFLTGTWEWVWEDLIGEAPPAPRAMYASPADQKRAFEALWDGGRGSHHWDASRSCWGQMLPS